MNESKALNKNEHSSPPRKKLNFRLFLHFPVILTSLFIFAFYAAAPEAALALTGAGTNESPYLIATADDLAEFRSGVNDGSMASSHARLTNDINLSELADEQSWTPVGKNKNTPYKGIFDGGGRTISNLNISVTGQDGDIYAGLFGYIDFGTVQNLTISNVNINIQAGGGMVYAGGIAGTNHNGTVSNCIVDGAGSFDVSSNAQAYTGVIVGSNECDDGPEGEGIPAVISNCTAKISGDVSASASGKSLSHARAGGIAGQNTAIYGGMAIITNCGVENSASITAEATGSWALAGGVVGDNAARGDTTAGSHGTATISNCTVEETVSVTSEAQGEGGMANAGGIAGANENWRGFSSISSCTSEAAVKATATDSDASSNAGGIVGYEEGMGGGIVDGGFNIANCINSGSVESDGYAGGIAGHVKSFGVGNCVNTGKVTATESGVAGGIIGDGEHYNAENCGWLTGTADKGIGSGITDTTVQLTEADTSTFVMSVSASSASVSLEAGKTAEIAFTTKPNESGTVTIDSVTGDGVAANAERQANKIIITGIAEGTANVTATVRYNVTNFADTSAVGPETTQVFIFPVTVMSASGGTEGNSGSGSGSSGSTGGGGGGCSAGFGALALLTLVPLFALKRGK